jgi:VanZ family protein
MPLRPMVTMPSKPTARNIALRFLPAIACMAGIFFLSHQPRLPELPSLSGQLTSVLGHFTVYFALAVLVWWALGAFDIPGRQRVGLAFSIAFLFGLSDEWHQSFIPGRTPDWRDILTDAIGAACGLLVVTHLACTQSFGRYIS